MALIVFAAPRQGAPGPKGEPGEGLSEVCEQRRPLFFLPASFEKQPEVNTTVLSVQGEAVQQLREALKILAERVLILEHMIGVHGEEKLDYAKKGLLTFCKKKKKKWKIPSLSRSEFNDSHSEMCNWKQIYT